MYSLSSLAGKVQDKESLLQETGLAAEPDRPLFVMVSRLVAQKGVDLVLGAFDQMMSLPINLMVLCTGDTEIETALAAKAVAYPGHFVSVRNSTRVWHTACMPDRTSFSCPRGSSRAACHR